MSSPRSLGARISHAFTLIELLVVVAIIALLISILLPSLSTARQQAQATKCLAAMHVFGQGMEIYSGEENGSLPGGRLPKIDSCNAVARIAGGMKYRPTFVAMMSHAVGAPPFRDPQACGNTVDMFGEKGDRQNYDYPMYVCPTVATWTDERNASYGFNYQFLGNSRLRVTSDPTSYKNWPVKSTSIKFPARTVVAADAMGTAASAAKSDRHGYLNNGSDSHSFGNEGFNLDPPRVDMSAAGEMASVPEHTSIDPRHRGKGNALRLDGSATSGTLQEFGYKLDPDGKVRDDGDNTQWTGTGRDVAWSLTYTP